MFTKQFEVSLDIVAFLDKTTPKSVAQITNHLLTLGYHYSEDYPRALLRQLLLAGVVESKKGYKGGYVLASVSLTALEILDAVTPFRAGQTKQTQEIIAALRCFLSGIVLEKNGFSIGKRVIFDNF